ncbi:unnamed protein product [Owenia fusiformis]|uniref:Peptidase M14 domain-containing protein n=1 Tax=Owenia fusiformis TaxID=6347 RepID=A0A8J1XT96_OWEFU|nr:unnamed protein product [Owenia fusiformis]
MKALVILVSCLCLCLAEKVRYDGHKVLRLVPVTEDQIETLHIWHNEAHKRGLIFWGEPGLLNQAVDVQFPPEKFAAYRTRLNNLGFQPIVLFDNVQSELDNQEAARVTRQQQTPTLNFFTDYRTAAEIFQWLDQTAANCPAGATCTVTNIGTSWEGRELKVFRISNGPNKRAIWIDSLIHAREWISGATNLYFIDQLVNNYNNAANRAMVDAYDWVFMPIINIDGYQYTFDTDRMWRRTRSDRGDILGCVGCDANRNFDFQWMTIGASDDPCSNTYAGVAPNSEPEVDAVRAYIMQNPSYYGAFITMHSYSQLFLLPYGYTVDFPQDYDEMMRVADLATEDLFNVHGTVYESDSASVILYPSSGTSRDWAKGVPQIKYVYTFELRDTGNYGFILPPEQIIPSGQETWEAVKRIAQEITFP